MKLRAPFRLSLLVVALVAAGCGGGDDGGSADTDSPATTEAAVDTTVAQVETTTAPTPATEPAATEPAGPTLPAPAAWDGPMFDAAIEPTMEALGAAIGQPFDPAIVAPELTLPAPTPLPGAATITGAGWESEIDSFDGSFEQHHYVGLDLATDPTALQTWSAGPIDGWTSPSFAESGSLYTSLLMDALDQRLVLVLDTDAAASGSPVVNLDWAPTVDAMRTPDWLAALPRPEGGVPSEIAVGRGVVSVGFAPGLDGNVFVRFDYEPTELDRMIAYFEEGVLLGAGFTYEPSPLSNTSYRRDVVMGDWSGEVSIGEVTSGDEVIAMQVIWSLTRVA